MKKHTIIEYLMLVIIIGLLVVIYYQHINPEIKIEKEIEVIVDTSNCPPCPPDEPISGCCIYDVNRDGIVDYRDTGLCWTHRDSITDYNPLYDVNCDGFVDYRDVGLIWEHRD